MTGPNTQSMFNLTNGTSYDRDGIYAHSTDQKGHYEQVRVKVTPSIEAELAQFVASKTRDYRTIEDFVRNAIVHQLHYEYTKVWPQAGPVITAEIMMSDVNRQNAKIQAWDMVIKSVADTGETLLAHGALEELGEMLTKYDQDFVNMDLPIVKQLEMETVLDTLHVRLKRARKRDYQVEGDKQ